MQNSYKMQMQEYQQADFYGGKGEMLCTCVEMYLMHVRKRDIIISFFHRNFTQILSDVNNSIYLD